ncbi:TIGR01777 family protein [Nocardia cyriacigeorgica]|uniref:TIGR01777 family protein n=1 Tax=Nocardia cyriacigeorgica TaxID=135487 RepID=A0A6P1CPR7_9NOCA|nr:TIGR01777 family oxidoreductase [Nocardia cyriacigeorgica]MBF6427176.1 TIGR01777 family protein [Nocardia cyriacigeorgica]NEW33364.1 TIGR01777 family protein [Nocardia cyriacigeorgica]
MSIECSAVVAVPRSEVFAWFARPGAFARLAPPWQPVRLVEETCSLADGRAVLALPGGLRWIARHQPEAYDPPARFADRISRDGVASVPLATALSWRHTHEFAEVDPTHTRVIDRVDSWLPAAMLRPMFAYRYRQLTHDLAAHARAAAHGLGPSTIAVTGSSGLIGSALTAFLSAGGHTVVRLVRREPHGPDERRWNPDRPDEDLLAGVDAVIHLAGASIAGRFTVEHKRSIRDSRVAPTRALAELSAAAGVPTFVCASAIGYYGSDRGDEVLTETSPRGDGFLADVVAEWEDAAAAAATGITRMVTVRTGIVQSPRGGTLRLVRPLFATGLGGRIGDGRQWMSWIGIDDLIDIYHRALWDGALRGPVNAVAPEPVRNAEFTRTLGRVLGRPTPVPVPDFGPALLLGREGAHELAAASQRVTPQLLLRAEHPFRTPDLESALRHVLGRSH